MSVRVATERADLIDFRSSLSYLHIASPAAILPGIRSRGTIT
jgi:hypothetical protein